MSSWDSVGEERMRGVGGGERERASGGGERLNNKQLIFSLLAAARPVCSIPLPRLFSTGVLAYDLYFISFMHMVDCKDVQSGRSQAQVFLFDDPAAEDI